LYNIKKMANRNKIFLQNYQQYKDKIYTYVWYRVNFDRDIAEDLTSEIFIKAFAGFGGFDLERPFQSWIYAIAKNHLMNYYRTANRETGLNEAADMQQDELGKIHVSMELKNVIGKIRELESYHREVLLLRYVDGFDNKEIAEILDKDEGTVRTQISRALSVLRKNIKYE
jgi:RNA polymerase sigma-70 factor, ECF subfamily